MSGLSNDPCLLKGGLHQDLRGEVAFVNGFDMARVKRFYAISPAGVGHLRDWQGHKKEQKWFMWLRGIFLFSWSDPMIGQPHPKVWKFCGVIWSKGNPLYFMSQGDM